MVEMKDNFIIMRRLKKYLDTVFYKEVTDTIYFALFLLQHALKREQRQQLPNSCGPKLPYCPNSDLQLMSLDCIINQNCLISLP